MMVVRLRFPRQNSMSSVAADHLHPFPHAQQAQTFLPPGVQYAVHLERFAVVTDLHANAVRHFLDIHFHLAGLRMTGYVVERLLGDAVKDRAPVVGQVLALSAKAFQMDMNARAPGK